MLFFGQLVVSWLERNDEQLLLDYYDNVEFSVDKMGAW